MFSYRSLIFFKTWIEFKRYLLRLYYVLSIVKKNSHLHNYNKLPLCWTVNSLCHHTRVISKQLVGTIFGKTLSFLNWESDTNPLFIRSGWKWPTLKYNAMEVFPLCYWLTTGQHNSYKEKLKVIKRDLDLESEYPNLNPDLSRCKLWNHVLAGHLWSVSSTVEWGWQLQWPLQMLMSQ